MAAPAWGVGARRWCYGPKLTCLSLVNQNRFEAEGAPEPCPGGAPMVQPSAIVEVALPITYSRTGAIM